jgi:hypothetical protein
VREYYQTGCQRYEVDGTGSGSCPVVDLDINGVEPSRFAVKVSELMRWILGKQAVRMGGGWKWLRIVSSGRLW